MFEKLAHLPPLANHTLLTAWWFVFGACVGSFLNVVVYRLPAGLSIARPPSHCPRCKAAIRWRDNLPIFGWILLGGRCRDCRAPIAARYPLVELLTGLMFLVVGGWIAVRGARFASVAEAWIAAAFYLTLLSTLWAATLIARDGQRVPRSLWIPAAVVGLIAPLWAPFLVRAPYADVIARLGGPWATLAVGLAVGWLAGQVLSRMVSAAAASGLVWGMPLVGLFLGWQASGAIAVVLLAVAGGLRWSGGRWAVSLSAVLMLAALGWILGFA